MDDLNDMCIMRGDIYYVENAGYRPDDNKPGRPAIVVSNDRLNRFSENIDVVYLTTQEKTEMETHVPVMCRVPSTALCEAVYTVKRDRLMSFVRRCSDEEMQGVDRAICIALAIPHGVFFAVPRNNDCGGEDTARMEAELAVYKRLYDDLLQKVMRGQ